MTPVPKRIVTATVVGNAIEFYDFVVYAFFAVYIGKAFFPAATPHSSLFLALVVFGVGFVMRPLGGIVLGIFADRVGRKPAMMLTVALITLGTLVLGLTPTFESIGIAAPIIIVLARLVQGFALGGEVGPSTAFLVESAPAHRRGLYGSWQMASQGAAMLVAGAIGLGLMMSLSPQDMQAWGWRVPFLLSLALLPVAFYLRRNMPETLHAKAPAPQVEHAPLAKAYKRKMTLLSILVVAGGTVATYVGTYMTTYAVTTLKLPPVVGMVATLVMGLSTLVFSLVGGWLSDKYGRKPVMLWPRVAIVLFIVPVFMYLVAQPSLAALMVVTAVLTALSAISAGASIVAIPEIMPRQFRATGLAIAYAVGVSVFGGTTQVVVTWLIGETGEAIMPAVYVAGASLIAALAILGMPESGKKALRD